MILIPGFLFNDVYLVEMYAWLKRLGYCPYFSGIGWNAECPNLLMRTHLDKTMDRARQETGRRIHLIGHSLGGNYGAGGSQPAPGRCGFGDHPGLAIPRDGGASPRVAGRGAGSGAHCVATRRQRAAGLLYRPVHLQLLVFAAPQPGSDRVSDGDLYPHRWGCGLEVLHNRKPGVDFEVPGSHIGLAFNPTVYHLIAERLAASAC